MNNCNTAYEFEDVFTASENYASRFSGSVGKWLLDVQYKTILECLSGRLNTNKPVLDLAGAHGQLLDLATVLGKRLLIVASHLQAFRSLRSRIDKEQSQKVVSNLLQLPYADNSFEIVSSIRFISHIENWQGFIAEMCRVSDKYVIIDYPPLASSNIFYSLLFPLKKKMEGNTRTFTIFKHNEIDDVFKAHGFTKIQRKGQFFWPMVLHRKIKSVALSKFLELIPAKLGLTKILGNPVIAIYSR